MTSRQMPAKFNAMDFRNTTDVSRFVDELLEFLGSAQEIDLADLLARASRLISGSPVEYLTEVDLALKRILLRKPKTLSGEREEEIRQAIREIDDMFRTIGEA